MKLTRLFDIQPQSPRAVSKSTSAQTFATPPRPLALPPLHEGTAEEREALAALRGVSVDAVALAVERGVLRFGEHLKKPAWFILDAPRIATARRLDGKECWDGVKAPFLTGSQARWRSRKVWPA